MKKLSFVIEAENYKNYVEFLNSEFCSITRFQSWTIPKVFQTDVSTCFWGLACFKVEPGIFFIVKNGQNVPVDENTIFYLPPFSIFKSLTLSGTLSWKAFVSLSPPPADLPLYPTLFQSKSKNTIAMSFHQLFRQVKDQSLLQKEVGLGTFSSSPLALRIKKKIDSEFCEEKKVSDLCKEMGICQESSGRAFKKIYGLTPSHYRKKMRLTHAMALLLLRRYNVTRTSLDVGFSDFNNFSKQFRRTFLVRPSQFLSRSE